MAHGRFDNPVVASMTGILDIFRKQKLSERLTDNDRIDGKTCLVTGANTGLGFAIAVDLAKRGAKVIMACRSQIPEAGEKVKKISGSDNVVMKYLDLSKIDTIHSFVADLKNENITLDFTVLNAGVALPKAKKTASGLDEIFLVNYLSNFILLNLLLNNGIIPNSTISKNKKLEDKPSRVIFISSDSHQKSSFIDHDEFGRYFEYGLKKGMNNYSYYKLVLNTLAVEISKRMNKDTANPDVSFNVICPGPVNTNIVRDAPWLIRMLLKGIFSIFFQSPEKAAKAVSYITISNDFEGKTAAYMHMFNPKEMDYKIYIPEEGIKLWEHSVEVWKRVDENAVLNI
ncbi:SDR family NAD(P)-dependent oxidoreductase [Lutibacter sp. HS1-25]|uniref:SDR family NAD(P)-dependent oxidoreductase n=1 Tax=Lutibacter sp. HS1-25 TaxID=2485000 RepID=UPI0010134E6A|nr:SDR family NAD(P)-dependent oxidoreductase [Lutibacter sp. HS1-25]RXP56602.1 SDR family NAD(P)-dependent oxidoreductase [Lutibacter sp. HS1-25]